AMAAAGMPSIMTTEEQFDTTADQLRVWVRERLLASANLESKTDDEAIHRLHGDPTCRALPKEGDPPDFLPALNASCVDQLDRLIVRLPARAHGGGGGA